MIFSTSSFVILPEGPVPRMPERSIPFSKAILRATGGAHSLDVTFVDDENLATPWLPAVPATGKLPARPLLPGQIPTFLLKAGNQIKYNFVNGFRQDSPMSAIGNTNGITE